MNLFLSWSGTLSHEVAKALVSWIPQVIQAVKPWLSSQDIEKGARWFEEIGDTLSTTDFGILCLTSTNLAAPWILFEAGALSKSLGQSRVCPLLVNIKNADLTGPLAQFNTSGIGKEEVRRLVGTLNARLPAEGKRTDQQLDEAFQVWWPHLERRFAEAIASTPQTSSETATPKRRADDVLDEILELSRLTAQQVARLTAEPAPAPPAFGLTLPRGSVGELAAELGRPSEALMEQFAAAGVPKSSPASSVTDDDKAKLLAHLRSAHGMAVVPRKKVVLTRRKR